LRNLILTASLSAFALLAAGPAAAQPPQAYAQPPQAYAQPPQADAQPPSDDEPLSEYAPPPSARAAPAPGARRLPPPNIAQGYGDRIGRVADALMDIDLGPLVDAIEPGARYRGGPTSLGALAARRDPYARARMHRDIDATTAGLGAAARDAAVMAPLVRQALARTLRDIDAAAREARARHGDIPPPPPRYEDGPGW
jgi:hypothetical protein